MKRYRKKPVIIEAVQYSGTAHQELAIRKWMSGEPYEYEPGETKQDHHMMHIQTLEGVMTALPGDYIVKGVQGEFYPVKEKIFLATYEEVSDE